jgi:hypothetical protein
MYQLKLYDYVTSFRLQFCIGIAIPINVVADVVVLSFRVISPLGGVLEDSSVFLQYFVHTPTYVHIILYVRMSKRFSYLLDPKCFRGDLILILDPKGFCIFWTTEGFVSFVFWIQTGFRIFKKPNLAKCQEDIRTMKK